MNAVLHKIMIQHNVEVIDNTTSSSYYFVQEKNIVNLINIYQMQVFHVCLAYLDILPFSILNQAYSFLCNIRGAFGK